MAGFTFVGREAELAAFRQMLERPQGELLVVAGGEGTGKSHLLRQFRQEAELDGRHAAYYCRLGHLLDADLRQYAVIRAIETAHEGGSGEQPEVPAGAKATVRLVPNPHEFFGYLLGEDRRPAAERLRALLVAASRSLEPASRLVLLLDMGRAEGETVFPIEALARRLPEGVKLVVALNEPPAGVAGLGNATVIPKLPPLGEADVRRLVEFHCQPGTASDALAALALARFGGDPLLTDAAVKLAAGAPDPATALTGLPAEAPGLCQRLLNQLTEERRAVVECLARAPSGLDLASLRALLDMPEDAIRRVLMCREVQNVVLTHSGAGAARACVFQECFADLFFGEKSPEVAAFHKRAAAHFLSLVQKNPHDIEALAAHSFHIRLSGDHAQFMTQDFPRTLRAKQNLGLLHMLAGEYRVLLMWSRSGATTVNRPLCMANLARIYQQLGDLQEALRHHREALDIYQKENDRNGTATQLAAIASVLSELGHREEAAKSLQQALAISESTGSKAAVAADLAALGSLQERLGHLDEALRSHQRAADLYRELKNDLDLAEELAHVAALHHKLGKLREAIARYQEAWRLNSRHGAVRATLANLCELGTLFDQLGDREKAVNCLQQAIELARSLGDRHAEATHLRSLAAMHLKALDPDEAVRCLEQAVTVTRSFADPVGEVAALLELAAARRAAGRAQEARSPLEAAAALAARLCDPDAQAKAQSALEDLDRLLAEERELAANIPSGKPAAPEPAAEEVALDGAGHADAADDPAELRRQLHEARLRIAELEAELAREKQIAETLQDIMAKAMQSR